MPPLEAWSREASVSVCTASVTLPEVKEGLDFLIPFQPCDPRVIWVIKCHLRCGGRVPWLSKETGNHIPSSAGEHLLWCGFLSFPSRTSCPTMGWWDRTVGQWLGSPVGERSGFQTQHQPKWSLNQGIRMSHFCSPFWVYFSAGCDTRNLATQNQWHHLIFLQQVWQPYKMPYRKKSSHHRHWIPKKKLMWLCALLFCLFSPPQGFY